jgi:hypothetical protein
MVRFEERLQEKRPRSQQRLFGADPPVVDDVDVAAVLAEGPFAAAVEVAGCDQREAVRV